jgi:hypothetical protein
LEAICSQSRDGGGGTRVAIGEVMKTHSFRQSLLAVLVVGALSPLALLDCASSNSGTGNPDGGVCPAAEPTSGSLCFAAEATMCNYPGAATPSGAPGCYCCNGGGSPSFVCSKGKWQELAYASGGAGAGPANFMACPATIPKQGAFCQPGCGGAQQSCSYNCETGNGQAGSATCVNGLWNISPLGLACPADAGTDARDASDAARD